MREKELFVKGWIYKRTVHTETAIQFQNTKNSCSKQIYTIGTRRPLFFLLLAQSASEVAASAVADVLRFLVRANEQ